MRYFIAIILAVMLAGQAWGGSCGGSTPCACGDTVTSSYTLTGNLSCTNTGNALNVGANDIIIDLGGYTISGDDTNVTIGINNSNYTSVTIQNGTIVDTTDSGVLFGGSSTGLVQNINCNSTGNQGFQNTGTANVVYKNITANNNVDDGFSMHDSSVATIDGGTFENNEQNINIIDDSVLTANNVSMVMKNNSTSYAILLTGSTGLLSATFNNLTVTGSSTSKHIYSDSGMLVINGLSMTSSGSHGIYCYNNATVTINNSVVDGEFSVSPILNANTGSPFVVINATTVDGNNIGSHLIDIMGGSATIKNTIIKGMADTKYAIAVRSIGSAYIYNNIVIGSGKIGNGIFTEGTSTTKNNIFYDLGICIIRTAGTPSVDYNLFYLYTTKLSGTITSTNEVIGNPLFISATNFNLQSSSPAIFAGTPVDGATYTSGTGAVLTDYAGNPWHRYTPSIGAYSYLYPLTISGGTTDTPALTASGGTGSFTWSIVGSPSWLTVTPSGTGNTTGTISSTGLPSRGRANVQVTDGYTTASKLYRLGPVGSTGFGF